MLYKHKSSSHTMLTFNTNFLSMLLRFILILTHVLMISQFALGFLPPQPDLESGFTGKWTLINPNAGVAAMQLQLMPSNKYVWFDTTALGDSTIKLDPPGYCPRNFENTYDDCFAHAVEFDIATAKSRPLELRSDPWCSSGVLAPTGNLVVTGGFNKGIRSVRTFKHCPDCGFQEAVDVLGENRWYASNAILPDGTYIALGGRLSFSYEILPPDTLQFPKKVIPFPFLRETTDSPGGALLENNLYPFVFLLTDGNIVLLANNRTVVFEPQSGRILRELPVLGGGARNYPASGSAVLLPIDLRNDPQGVTAANEMLVCGGNTHEAFLLVEGLPMEKRVYVPALQDCARIDVLKPGAQWLVEQMPSRRVMGDMVLLPNGHVLIINGAQKGTAAWWDADEANLTPAIYDPTKPVGDRFKQLAPTDIPRMYHSVAAMMPDGKVLIAGSNPHNKYIFNAKYVTELRVQTFEPPYLDPAFNQFRPEILEQGTTTKWNYGGQVQIAISVAQPNVDASVLRVVLYCPPFVSHAFSMNQRMIYLNIVSIQLADVVVMAPPNGKIAPPGYYLMYALYKGVPSKGFWVSIC